MPDRHHFRTLAFAVLVLGSAGCLQGPQVCQGAVESYDAASQRLVVKDAGPPQGRREFLLEGAEVGGEPRPGDVVRIAYREREGRAHATRVMNLSRQGELAKKGAGGH